MSPVYCALVHHPVRDRRGETVTTALTNLDVHDLSRSSRTYGLSGFYVISPIAAQQRIVQAILEHWDTGAGKDRVPERREALSLCAASHSVDAAAQAIEAREGIAPEWIGTAARPQQGKTLLSFEAARARIRDGGAPLLLLFGTGHGLAAELLGRVDALLAPIRPSSGYNHLSVRAAAAIIFDRLLGEQHG